MPSGTFLFEGRFQEKCRHLAEGVRKLPTETARVSVVPPQPLQRQIESLACIQIGPQGDIALTNLA